MTRTKPFHLLALIAIVLLCLTIMAVRNSSAKPQSAAVVETKSSTPLNVDRLDPSIDRIIPADAKLERIASGFKWIEGPVWAEGSLYFLDEKTLA